MQKRNHDWRYFTHGVWLMWREENGFRSPDLWRIGTWLSMCGILTSAVVAALTHGVDRYVSVSTLVVFFVLVVLSAFKSAYGVWYRDTPKLDLIEEQKRNTSQFIYSRLVRLLPRESNEVDIDVEWFNGTVFTLEFQKASGSVTMNKTELGQIIPDISEQRCDPGRHCTRTLHFKPDPEPLKTIRQRQSEQKGVDWSMNVEWQVLVKDTTTKMTLQGPSGTKRIVPEETHDRTL